MENWRNAGEHDKLGFNWSIYENMGQDIILNKMTKLIKFGLGENF